MLIITPALITCINNRQWPVTSPSLGRPFMAPIDWAALLWWLSKLGCEGKHALWALISHVVLRWYALSATSCPAVNGGGRRTGIMVTKLLWVMPWEAVRECSFSVCRGWRNQETFPQLPKSSTFREHSSYTPRQSLVRILLTPLYLRCGRNNAYRASRLKQVKRFEPLKVL